jgi:tetratricopeptide (TPR) repeat protein
VRRASSVVLLACLMLTGLGCQKFKARVLMRDANNLYKSEKYLEAIQKYEQVIKIDPWWAEAYRNAGLAYLALYQPGSLHKKDVEYSENAIIKLRRYLQFVPTDERMEDLVMDTYLKTGRYEEAANYYKEKLKKDPKNSKVLQTIGMIYAKASNFEEARKWFRARAEADDKNPEAWYSLGVLCWERAYKGSELLVEEKRSLIDEGMQALTKAVELRKDYFEAFSYINLLWRQKALTETDPEEAQKDIQQADINMRKALQLRNEQMKKGA